MVNSKLAQFCQEENRVRSSFYCDTYRKNIEIDGSVKECHITHMSLPFEPEEETKLMEKTGLAREDLPVFYHDFGKRVSRALNQVAHLQQKDPDTFESLLLKPIYKEVCPKTDLERGSDLYIVTDIVSPLIGSDFLTEDHTTYLNLLRIGVRLTQAVKALAKAGEIVGPIDLRDVYFRERDRKQYMVLGPMLYAQGDGGRCPVQPRYANAFQEDASDVQYLSALLWSLFDGDYLETVPNLKAEPRHAPPALVNVLREGLAGRDDVLKQLYNVLYQEMNSVTDGKRVNYHIRLQEPSETPKQPEIKEEAELPKPAPVQEVPPTTAQLPTATAQVAQSVPVVIPQISTGDQRPVQPLYILVPPATAPVAQPAAQTPQHHRSEPEHRREHRERPVKVERSSAGLLVGVTIFATILSIVFIVENIRLWDYYGYDSLMAFFQSWG